MKKYFIAILQVFILGFFGTFFLNAQWTKDLTNLWDTVRPLVNPDKGWYHHMLDNGTAKYLLKEKKHLENFPGLDHFYLRLCWAYLEPEEGKYNWKLIDTIIQKYTEMGYGISFRITCKETGNPPGSVPYEINGIRYATPYWVREAGAKGIEQPEFGSPCWTPDLDDPIFLEKLDCFHKEFAKRYDGKPWVRYIDVGSIGDWGEGHTHSSTRIPPTVRQVITHLELYKKHYRKSTLVVTDDLLCYGKNKAEVKELYNFAINNNFTLRDDSPMVKYYIQNYITTYSISHPEFYDPLYLTRPIIFELEHYTKVKANGYWLGKNGKEIIPDIGFSGAYILMKSIETLRATYIGFHGYLEEWLTDNPDLTGYLLNKCGYWYFPAKIETNIKADTLLLRIKWVNKGVAPAYNKYTLKVRLENEKRIEDFQLIDSGNTQWLPDKPVIEEYRFNLPEHLYGEYSLAVQLYDEKSKKPVEIGLATNCKKDNYFKLIKIQL